MNGNAAGRSLAERELDVLRLVDEGASASRMERELGLDRRAVARTLVDIRQALGVGSTRAAVEIARALPEWDQRRTF